MSDHLFSTAIHEAGHAVIGRVLGLRCGSVTIVPDEDEGEAGHGVIADPWVTYSAWDQAYMEAVERGEQPVIYRQAHMAFRGRIIAFMAGAAAESELTGQHAAGDAYDRQQIELMAAASEADLPDDLWRRYEPRMRRQTCRLVRRHRNRIARVAASLLERGTLQSEQIDALMKGD